MTKFFDGEQPVKIVLTFSGSHADLLSEYYFKDGDLFFVVKTKTIYHRSKQDSTFQESMKSIARSRFYMKGNQLVKWVDTDINSVSKENHSFKVQEAMIVHDYQLYRNVE